MGGTSCLINMLILFTVISQICAQFYARLCWVQQSESNERHELISEGSYITLHQVKFCHYFISLYGIIIILKLSETIMTKFLSGRCKQNRFILLLKGQRVNNKGGKIVLNVIFWDVTRFSWATILIKVIFQTACLVPKKIVALLLVR